MANSHYDVIVIGTGSAGSTVSFPCKEKGLRIAAIEEAPPGGTCSQRGCDPKKILLAASECMDFVTRMTGNGIDPGGAKIDWPALMKVKRGYTEPIPDKTRTSYEKRGIDLVEGQASFLDAKSISVGGQTLTADKFVIATGAHPRRLDIPGAESLLDSEAFLDLDELPESLVFVGGGYIGFEFAHLAIRAGARVTILESKECPLAEFDPDLVGRLVDHSRKLGIEVVLGVRATRVEKGGDGIIVHADDGKSYTGASAINSAGRVPNIESLELDKAGIKRSKKGVVVNDKMQSVSTPHIYATGDCADSGGLPLTPVAGYEGKIAADHICGCEEKLAAHPPTASVVFTLPQLARCGMLEDEARDSGLKYTVRHKDNHRWFSNLRHHVECSAFKILIEEETGRILGAHLLGHEAGDTINLFSLAMTHGLTVDDVRMPLYGYPTATGDFQYMVK